MGTLCSRAADDDDELVSYLNDNPEVFTLPVAPLAGEGEILPPAPRVAPKSAAPQHFSEENNARDHPNEDRVFVGNGEFSIQNGTKFRFQVVGLADGHGGDGVCNFFADQVVSVLSENMEACLGDVTAALYLTFSELEEQCEEDLGWDSGACVCLCVVAGDQIWTANLGDCRAISFGLNGDHTWLSIDQKVNEGAEFERILNLGGSIRDAQGLQPSRSIGDTDVKSQAPPGMILAEPEIRVWEGKGAILIGTDGLWDTITEERLLELWPYQGDDLKRACRDEQKLKDLAKMLVNEAIELGSEDDVTAIIVPVM